MYSPLTKRSMAIARLSVDVARHGTSLEVRGAVVAGSATAHTLPFDDPKKTKRTAIG
jgi:aminomethyltransferase